MKNFFKVVLIMVLMSMTIFAFADTEVEPNDTWDGTGVFVVGNGTHDGTIDPGQDLDYFAFQATTDDEVVVSTVGLCDIDTKLWIYDIDGVTELAYNDDATGVPGVQSEVTLTIPLSGMYYFVVGTYGTNIGVYGVSLAGANTPTFLDNDLLAMGITANLTPTIGTLTTASVSMMNIGNNEATNFSVELFDGNDVNIGSTDVASLAAGENLTVDVEWTPDTEGIGTIYAVINYAADEDTDNNQTDDFTVDVQGAGTVVVTIGQGEELINTLPLDFYYKNSLSAQLYYADELQIGGALLAVDFFYNFDAVPTTSDFKLWIGETTQTDLSGGFIPSTDLTLIHDGPMDYQIGDGLLHIPLATPIVYSGGNIVLLANRPLDENYYSSQDYFYSSIDEVNVARSIEVHGDLEEFDPANPPTEGNVSGNYANAAFYFQVSGMGSITGTVTSAGTPIEGAMVAIDGTPTVATTDANGVYTFPVVMEGDVALTATMHGYVDGTTTVVVVEDETTTADITMDPLLTVMVSGSVFGSDSPTVGIEGAMISLAGYEAYEGTTDANGLFEISGVYANQTYDIAISAEGYEGFTGTVEVVDTDVVIDDVSLEEVGYPAVLVAATPNADMTSVDVTWQAPGSGIASFSDDFESGNYDAWNEVIIGDGTGGDGGLAYWAVGEPDLPYDGLCSRCDWGYTIDTWLITDPITVSAGTTVSMDWNSSYYWSVDPNDRCDLFVKVSADAGNTWETVWTFGEIGPWDNFVWYTSNISLEDYVDQAVLVAFNVVADDNANIEMDNVVIGESTRSTGTYAISSSTKSADNSRYATSAHRNINPSDVNAGVTYDVTRNTRAVESYKVYRLLAIDQETPGNWSMVAEDLTDMTYTDAAFDTVANDVYKYAVVAVYTYGIEAPAAFSNEVFKGVRGTVSFEITTNDGMSAEGASITFIAQDGDPEHVYSAEADADGEAVIENVWFETYDLAVTLPAYNAYAEANIVFDDDATITVELEESINAPLNLEVTEVTDDTATITWEEPIAGTPGEFRYDDGVVTNQVGFQNSDNSVLGAAHPYNAVVSEITWYLTSNEAHPEAVLYILGLDESGMPDQDQLLHQSSPQVNVDDAWNTYTLDSPVETPNGFFVGVATPGIFVALGLDDGVDEPYVFQDGTQWGISDFTAGTNEWIDIGSAGYPNNFTIRATGFTVGRAEFTENVTPQEYTGDELVYSELDRPVVTDHPDYVPVTREVIGYKVYLDGNVVAEDITDLTYQFTGLDLGTDYVAGVTAVYTGDVESEMVTVEFTTTTNSSADDIIPLTTELKGNYPNPFNPTTNISFTLKEAGNVTLEVYNAKGQKIKTLVNCEMEAAKHVVTWNGDDNNGKKVSSGIYFYKMKNKSYTETKKMLLMK